MSVGISLNIWLQSKLDSTSVQLSASEATNPILFLDPIQGIQKQKGFGVKQKMSQIQYGQSNCSKYYVKRYVTHCRGTTFKIKNAPTGFDMRNRPALYMYIEEMVSEKTIFGGLFEKKPFSSQR